MKKQQNPQLVPGMKQSIMEKRITIIVPMRIIRPQVIIMILKLVMAGRLAAQFMKAMANTIIRYMSLSRLLTIITKFNMMQMVIQSVHLKLAMLKSGVLYGSGILTIPMVVF